MTSRVMWRRFDSVFMVTQEERRETQMGSPGTPSGSGQVGRRRNQNPTGTTHIPITTRHERTANVKTNRKPKIIKSSSTTEAAVAASAASPSSSRRTSYTHQSLALYC